MIVNDEDRHFMKVAIDEARRAYEEDEVPIGAVVVSKGRIIGRGQSHRKVERCHGPCRDAGHHGCRQLSGREIS